MIGFHIAHTALNHLKQINWLSLDLGIAQQGAHLLSDGVNPFGFVVQRLQPFIKRRRQSWIVGAIQQLIQALRCEANNAERLLDFMGNGGCFQAHLELAGYRC